MAERTRRAEVGDGVTAPSPRTPRTNPTATAAATKTATASATVTATRTRTPSPSATTSGSSPVVFPVGLGDTDVVPHQILRAGNDRLYLFTSQQYSTNIRAY